MLSKEASSTIFESLVWLDLELNPGLPGHWQIKYYPIPLNVYTDFTSRLKVITVNSSLSKVSKFALNLYFCNITTLIWHHEYQKVLHFANTKQTQLFQIRKFIFWLQHFTAVVSEMRKKDWVKSLSHVSRNTYSWETNNQNTNFGFLQRPSFWTRISLMQLWPSLSNLTLSTPLTTILHC